jgi:hypothetical protein
MFESVQADHHYLFGAVKLHSLESLDFLLAPRTLPEVLF